jgi:hypothetical protein
MEPHPSLIVRSGGSLRPQLSAGDVLRDDWKQVEANDEGSGNPGAPRDTDVRKHGLKPPTDSE